MNPHLHGGTHSSSLCLCDSTMVAAVLSLVGRQGWVAGGGVLEWSVQWEGARSLRDVLHRFRSGKKRSQIDSATNKLVKRMNYCQLTAGRSPHKYWLAQNLPHWSDVPITWKERGKKEHMMQQTLGKFYSFTERLQEISGLVRYLITMLLQYNSAWIAEPESFSLSYTYF